MKKRNYLLILVLFISTTLMAQKEYIEFNKKYSLSKIYTKDYQIMRVTSLEITNDTIVKFRKGYSSDYEQLSIKDVRYFSVKKGSKALAFGLAGAGIGLLSSIYGIASVKSNNYYYDDSNVDYAPIIVGFTVGCGAVGALIGAFCYKWKRLYINDNSGSLSFMIVPDVKYNSCGLNLYVNF